MLNHLDLSRMLDVDLDFLKVFRETNSKLVVKNGLSFILSICSVVVAKPVFAFAVS